MKKTYALISKPYVMINNLLYKHIYYSPRNSPSRPKGLKMVSKSKFCVDCENPSLSCWPGDFRAQ